jgi:hypothetical protein
MSRCVLTWLKISYSYHILQGGTEILPPQQSDHIVWQLSVTLQITAAVFSLVTDTVLRIRVTVIKDDSVHHSINNLKGIE